MDNFEYKYNIEISKEQLEKLFKSVKWKTGEYPNRLYKAIKNSEYVMSVWKKEELVGLLSAISDGAINVFITYLLVKPDYQKSGLGSIMMNDFCEEFRGYGRRILTTDWDKEKFYHKFGFQKEGIAMFNIDWQEDLK